MVNNGEILRILFREFSCKPLKFPRNNSKNFWRFTSCPRSNQRRKRKNWKYYYPRLQEVFPSQLGNVSLEAFYKGINRVEPSLSRVEADEATYNLHILLRLEIDMGLIENSLEVKDLPEIWNMRMQEYLGVTPPDNARGVLQDVHWSGGMIGYFATYALGSIVSGQFGDLLGWVRQKIHRHGSKFEPQELVTRVTGTAIDPAPYMRYLRSKYTEIYGL